MAVLQVTVKWLNKQRAYNREENKDGTSPLGIAAKYGYLEVAKWLEEQGVDSGEKDSIGWMSRPRSAQRPPRRMT